MLFVAVGGRSVYCSLAVKLMYFLIGLESRFLQAARPHFLFVGTTTMAELENSGEDGRAQCDVCGVDCHTGWQLYHHRQLCAVSDAEYDSGYFFSSCSGRCSLFLVIASLLVVCVVSLSVIANPSSPPFPLPYVEATQQADDVVAPGLDLVVEVGTVAIEDCVEGGPSGDSDYLAENDVDVCDEAEYLARWKKNDH